MITIIRGTDNSIATTIKLNGTAGSGSAGGGAGVIYNLTF